VLEAASLKEALSGIAEERGKRDGVPLESPSGIRKPPLGEGHSEFSFEASSTSLRQEALTFFLGVRRQHRIPMILVSH
jgi:hypothetical protein